MGRRTKAQQSMEQPTMENQASEPRMIEQPTMEHQFNPKRFHRDRLRTRFSQHIRISMTKTAPWIVPTLSMILLICIFYQIAVGVHATKKTGEYRADTETLMEAGKHDFADINDAYMTERLRQILTMEECIHYTNNLWTYTLTVNDNHIAGTTTVSIPDQGTRSDNTAWTSSPDDDTRIDSRLFSANPENGLLVVELVETCRETTLPDAIARQGSISHGDPFDTIDRHITIAGADHHAITKAIHVEGRTTTTTLTVHLPDSIVPDNGVVEIHLSPQLAQRLSIP
jgi:hypothetical protein